MLRRPLALLALVAVLASCGSTDVDTAATVNGTVVRASDLEQTVNDFVAIGEAQLIDGAADGETVRGLLTSLIRGEMTNQVLAEAGVSVTADDRSAARGEFDEAVAAEVPATLLDLIVELNAASAALSRVASPSADAVAARYDENPKSLGMLCLRHLVVETEATAREARAELGDAPTDERFAEVAGKFSTEPNAERTGGALAGQSGECISLNEYQAGFDPDFVEGAFAARTGVPTAPVRSSFGWHVIYVRPFVTVSESVSANLDAAAGEFLLLGALADADIVVASRYGRWNPFTGLVVAP